MKNDNDSTASGSQVGEQMPSQQIESSSSKAYDRAPSGIDGHDDEQAPPGYVAVENTEHSLRQPLIAESGAGAAGLESPAGTQTMYVVDAPRQTDADLIIDVLLYIVALAVPPASVIVKTGCGGHFWLNIILTMFGGIPGLLHAWYIITVVPGTIRNQARERAEQDAERGRNEAGIQI